MLELRGLSKRFGAVEALVGVDLRVEPGEVVGLMGDNGAGKSTLLRLVGGVLRPTEGEIRIADQAVRLQGPADARARGVEVVHQDGALCANLSATANVFLGRELTRRRLGVLPVLDETGMRARTQALLAELGSDARPEQRVGELSGGQRQAVAIARSMLGQPRIVLLDEPTAAISVRQVGEVLGLLARLRERGIAVVLVSHRLPDVFASCTRVAVLRRGRKVCDKPIAKSSPEEVTGLILGAIEAA